jgi:transcriptional regulator with XRE-family HTH domain
MEGTPVNALIATNVRARRLRAGLTLEALGAASGVSRSAISLIERGESSPTAVVLDKIAVALGVPLASLFADALGPRQLMRRDEQPVWRDSASGYVRRSVSPPSDDAPIQIAEVTFPAGARVVFESGARETAFHQQLWVLEGAIEVSVAGELLRLETGDCFASRLGQPTMFHNPTATSARYAVVVAAERTGWAR